LPVILPSRFVKVPIVVAMVLLLMIGPPIGLDGTIRAGGRGLRTTFGRNAVKDRSRRLFWLARNGPFGQGKIIAGEVALATSSGQRAHERRSAPRHRGINHLAAMILLSPFSRR